MTDRRFEFGETGIEGLKIVTRISIGDERGSLARLFCSDELALAGWRGPVAQVNHTVTRQAGAIRGMHFQYPPAAEFKLVSVVRGEVYDVAVDLRKGSDTFLCWHGEHLSAANRRALLIPEGFAHGFQTLTDDCELLYLHSNAYVAESEGGLNALDPRVGIDWPQPITIRSARDSSHPYIAAHFDGIEV
jgi:dTDP-4-dehydrorhamnose 3,5-epimerase